MVKFKQFLQVLRNLDTIGIDWSKVQYTKHDLIQGFYVELEHGTEMSKTNITDDDVVMTLKIAWRHLEEDKDYYTKLNQAGL